VSDDEPQAPVAQAPPVAGGTPGPGADAAPRKPRAGRDLPAAIGVAAVLLGLIGASLFFYKPAFVLVVTTAALLGVRELGTAIRNGRVHPPLPPLLLAAGLVPLTYWGGADALALGFAAAAALVLLWRAAAGPPEGAVRDIAGGVFIVAYVPLLASVTSLMLVQPDGVGRIITFILVTVASDTGGYAVGVLKGRTPMAPSLSPKKSWEGFGGSVVTSAVVGAACVVLLLGGAWWAGAVVGAVAAVFATVGDMAESSIKRDLGIKDMGHLLPGHGGIMDRLDSLLFTATASWALLHLLV
jgi:phosphatidate cytidylyltransferase